MMRTFHFQSKWLNWLLGILFLALITTKSFAALSANQATPWYSTNANKELSLRLEVFVSSNCPHCKNLEEFLKAKAAENKWLDIHYYVINESKKDLKTYGRFLKQQQLSDYSVPAVFFCKTRWLGFDTADQSGRALMNNLEYCYQHIQKEGGISQQTLKMLKQVSSANFYEKRLDWNLSFVGRVILYPFLDVLSPETAFVILTLFCFLFIQKENSLRPISFLLFMLGVGIAHYFQQRYTAYFYELVPLMRIPTSLLALGLLTYLLAFHPKVFSFKRSLPVGVSFMWFFLTGIAVQMYQQMHLPNFSLIFSQWVITQNISNTASNLYLITYQLVYLLMIGLLSWMLFYILSSYGKWSRHQRVVEEFSWQYLMIVAIILLVYPYLLVSHWVSFMVFIVAMISSWVSFRVWSKRHN